MRSVERALHPYYRYPYKKWKLAQRHTQRDDQVKTQGKDGHLYAKEKGLKGSQACNTLISDFWSPNPEENKCLSFKPPSL